MELKNHKQFQFDHIDRLKDPNLKFRLMLMKCKNLSKLFVLQSLILLFVLFSIIKKGGMENEKKVQKIHHSHIEHQKKVINIDNKNFHLILLNIFLHLNIYWHSSNLFIEFFLFFLKKKCFVSFFQRDVSFFLPHWLFAVE